MKLRVIIFLLVIASSYNVNAGNDPLKKPKVWEMLKESPSDEGLWAAYVGKSWVCMTIHEKEQIEKWQAEIEASRPAPTKNLNPEVHVAMTAELKKEIETQVFAEDDEFWEDEVMQSSVSQQEQVKIEAELQEHFEALEEKMVQTPSMINILSRDLRKNFILIEDEFDMEYESLGKVYTSYWEKHPNGKYSPEKWVYEKKLELKSFKKEEFEKIKSSMIASVSSSKTTH
ncbi:hypothetical protein [Flammeovirga pacifica]|uniref:YARHG domain-containing protein n=1 Tax=Flammeovirga pacifica TaxID=915059 RepID=A0A1S1Z160_FLAPC|nr:hypothetical protein [Flammeovirga pacifica]OHX67006.1 hypothetical protein NH26_11960 [Flammeovirga pacifica]